MLHLLSLAYTPRIDSVLQVFVQATEGLLSTTRFASTRFAKQKHASNVGNSSAVADGEEGTGGGPPRTEIDLDPYGDAAARGNRPGNERTGTGGRRPGDTTTGRGGARGWVLIVVRLAHCSKSIRCCTTTIPRFTTCAYDTAQLRNTMVPPATVEAQTMFFAL